jgi:hypothetical protein
MERQKEERREEKRKERKKEIGDMVVIKQQTRQQIL